MFVNDMFQCLLYSMGMRVVNVALLVVEHSVAFSAANACEHLFESLATSGGSAFLVIDVPLKCAMGVRLMHSRFRVHFLRSPP